MTARVPTEPARGPHLRLRRPDGLPPFATGAAVAFAAAILPWLTFAALWAVDALVPGDDLIGNSLTLAVVFAGILWITTLGGPVVAVAVGGVVHRRLRAMPEDLRPRGVGMVIAARVIGWLTLALWAAAIGVVCLSVRGLAP